MKCRIALYVPSMQGGGAERVMLTLAHGFAARGLAVDLVLASAEGPYLKEVAEAVRVVDLRCRRVISSLAHLVRYLRRERPRAMLSALGYANVVAVWARELARVPTRLVVSEHANLSLTHRYARTIRERLMPALIRRAYRRADGVVAVSGGVADDLAAVIGFPRERIKVVYNPVFTDELLRLSRMPLQHPWIEKKARPVVLSIGRLAEEKDFPTLLRAFARLRAKRPVRLVILGEGQLRAQLEALVANLGLIEDVAMPGFVDNPFAWMRHADLLVLSSVFEGFGNVLVEAMACGIPTVSTDCPSGPAEILGHGRWGRLVPVGDDAALADAIAATLDEAVHPNVLARAREFGVDRAVGGYLDALGLQVT